MVAMWVAVVVKGKEVVVYRMSSPIYTPMDSLSHPDSHGHCPRPRDKTLAYHQFPFSSLCNVNPGRKCCPLWMKNVSVCVCAERARRRVEWNDFPHDRKSLQTCMTVEKVLSWLVHRHTHTHTAQMVPKLSHTSYKHIHTHITLTLCLTQNHVVLYGLLLGDKFQTSWNRGTYSSFLSRYVGREKGEWRKGAKRDGDEEWGL